ncbi:MAG TPA: tetratricopeptide repeat protein [Dehalococcoidales bacterium]|nr:tetratricopeptide repeat protein [Dehalococcoidales bacterium]
MTFQEDKTGRLKRQTSKQAISLAMEGRWEETIQTNLNILEHFPTDVDACNRLGKGYMETGQYAKAKEAYEKAIQLDQYNTIARKNLQRIERLGTNAAAPKSSTDKAEPTLFIEEIGKAGVVNLYQIATTEKLALLMAGDKVILKPQDTSLAVYNVRGEYLGLVPAKFGQRLTRLMSGGNKYTAAVIATKENSLSIIIREIYQDPKQMGQVSFPGRKLEEILPFSSERSFRAELGDELIGEEIGLLGDETEGVEEAPEEPEEEKEWEQEA